MLRVVVRRLLIAIAMMAIVSFLLFGLSALAKGDDALYLAGPDATPDRIEEIRRANKLDRHFVVRYVDWVGDAVTGDLGRSLTSTQEVTDALRAALPVSLSIVSLGLLWSSVVALLLGSLSARFRGSALDRVITTVSALAVGIPSFCLALILAQQFAVKRLWFPASGYTGPTTNVWLWLKGMVLPVATLSAVMIAELTRQLRGSLVDALNSDFVLTARASGMRAGKVVYKHALKNAMVPVVTVFGQRFATLVGGTVIIETMFNMQGVGSLIARSAVSRDIPVLLGVAVFMTLAVQIVNLVVDATQRYFNPKLRPA